MTTLALLLFFTASAQGPADLSADTRLAAPITVRADAETVGAVVKRLSEQLKLPLSASERIEQDVVILFAKERPAHEVMSVVAKHFGWEWQKVEDGYKLLQTDEAKRDEEKKLEELILEQYLDFQKETRKLMKEAETADREKVLEELDAFLQREQELFKAERTREHYREMEASFEKRAAFQRKLNVGWEFIHSVVDSLHPTDWLELERTSKLVFSYRPTAAQRPLGKQSAAAAQLMLVKLQEQPKISKKDFDKDRQGAIRQLNRWEFVGIESTGAFGPDDVGTVRLTIRRHSPRTDSTSHQRPEFMLHILGRDGKVLVANHPSAYGVFVVREGQPAAPTSAAEGLDRPLRDTPELQAANQPVLQEQNLSVASLEAWRAFAQRGSNIDPFSGVARLLNEVASAAGINVVSDVYDSSSWQIPPLPTDTARHAFAALAGRLKANWSFDGTWCRFRARDWPLMRASSVPRKTLFAFRDRILSEGYLSLDTAAWLAQALSDRQALSPILSSLAQDEWSEFNWRETQASLYALRFWAALGGTDRQRLRNGEGLPYYKLPPAAKAALKDTISRLWIGWRHHTPVPTHDIEKQEDKEWVEAAWGVSEEGELRRGQDYEMTQVLPEGPHVDSTVELRLSESPAYLFRPFELRVMPMSAEALAMNIADQELGHWPTEREFQVKPAKRHLNFFTFRLKSGVTRGILISTTEAKPGAQFGPIKSLPEEEQKRLRSLIDEMKKHIAPAKQAPPPLLGER